MNSGTRDSSEPGGRPADPALAPAAGGAAAAGNDPYAAWRLPGFRLYAASWFLLTFGKLVEMVAVQVYIYRQTRDELSAGGGAFLSLGWIGLTQALPVLLLAIPGGQLADRFDRRKVLMTMLSLGTLASFGLVAVVGAGAPVIAIYALLLGGATTQALGGPSRAAMLPLVVPPHTFANAVTWNSSVFQVSLMTGPAVGGLIVGSALGAPAALTLAAVCRLLALGAVGLMRVQSAPRSDEAVSWKSLAAGIRFVRRTRLILATITLDLFAVLLGGATYLLPAFCDVILHVGAAGLGFLRSAEAVGAVGMALLLAHLPPVRRAGYTMLWGVAGFGCATIVLGLSRWYWLSLAMMFLIGALDNISVVVRHTLVQLLTPDRMRGRVSAVNNIFIVASNDLGGFESGVSAWLFGLLGAAIYSGQLSGEALATQAKVFGLTASVVAGGIGTIVVVLAAARLWPEIRALGRLTDIRPAEAARATQSADEELSARGP